LPGYRAPRGTSDAEQVALIGQALWKVHRVGVEGRVRRACKHLLRDASVSKDVRRQLAEALVREHTSYIVLSELYCSVGSCCSARTAECEQLLYPWCTAYR
jgi:hypothetical protein